MSRITFVPVLVVILAATGCGGLYGGLPPGGGPPPPGGGTVTVTLGQGVAWAAYQDGNGPWQRFSGASFQVTDPAGRYGFAYVCVFETSVAQVTVTQATVAELRTLAAACEGDTAPPTAYHVTGRVTNVGTGAIASVHTVSDSDGGLSEGASFDLYPTLAGTRDLVGLRSTNPAGCPDRVVFRRDLMVNAGVSGQDLDFAGGSGFLARPFTVSGATAGRNLVAAQNLLTKNETGVFVCRISTPSGQWQAVDSGVIAEDLYLFVALADSGVSGGPEESALKYVSAVPDPGSQSVTLPAPITGLSATGRNPLYRGLAYVSTTLPLRAYLLSHIQPGRWWIILVTAGWLGGASQYQTPDLSQVNGWNSAWEMRAGVEIAWSGSVHLSNRGLEEQPPIIIPAGRQVSSQVRARLAQTSRMLARPRRRAGLASVQPGTEVQWAFSGESRYTPTP